MSSFLACVPITHPFTFPSFHWHFTSYIVTAYCCYGMAEQNFKPLAQLYPASEKWPVLDYVLFYLTSKYNSTLL